MISYVSSTFISPTSTGSQEEKNVKKKSSEGSNLVDASVIVGTILVVPVIVAEVFQILKESFSSKHKDSCHDLGERVKTRFGEKVHQLFERIEGCMEKQVISKFAGADERETKLMKDIAEQFELTHDDLKEIAKGAHVRLDDNGQLYEIWKKTLGASPRHSSHPADATQYGMQGKFLKEFLFSRVTENGKTYTWFQCEKNPTRLGFLIRHMIDFAKYRHSGLNQGPYGQSSHTDKNPLILKRKSQGSPPVA